MIFPSSSHPYLAAGHAHSLGPVLEQGDGRAPDDPLDGGERVLRLSQRRLELVVDAVLREAARHVQRLELLAGGQAVEVLLVPSPPAAAVVLVAEERHLQLSVRPLAEGLGPALGVE